MKKARLQSKKRVRQQEFKDVDASEPLPSPSTNLPSSSRHQEEGDTQSKRPRIEPELEQHSSDPNEQVLKRVYTRPQVCQLNYFTRFSSNDAHIEDRAPQFLWMHSNRNTAILYTLCWLLNPIPPLASPATVAWPTHSGCATATTVISSSHAVPCVF